MPVALDYDTTIIGSLELMDFGWRVFWYGATLKFT
jgi:hypothetical protein